MRGTERRAYCCELLSVQVVGVERLAKEDFAGHRFIDASFSTDNLAFPNRANHRALSRPPSRRQLFAKTPTQPGWGDRSWRFWKRRRISGARATQDNAPPTISSRSVPALFSNRHATTRQFSGSHGALPVSALPIPKTRLWCARQLTVRPTSIHRTLFVCNAFLDGSLRLKIERYQYADGSLNHFRLVAVSS